MKILAFTLFLFASGNALATPSGDINLTPTALKLKVYKFAVSTSPLCTNLVTVIDNGSTPSEVNFVGIPALGTGTLANGTYPCVVIEFSDNIKFTSGTTTPSGACTAGTDNTLDVCRSGGGGGGGTSKLIDGTTTTCGAGSSDDRVAMYLSTASATDNTGDAFNPPVASGGDGFYLANPLVVTAAATAQFVVNPSGQMCDDTNDTGSDCDGSGSSARCLMGPPTFNFNVP